MAEIIFPNLGNAFLQADQIRSNQAQQRLQDLTFQRQESEFNRKRQALDAWDPNNPATVGNVVKLDPQTGLQAQTYHSNQETARHAQLTHMIDLGARTVAPILNMPATHQQQAWTVARQNLIRQGFPTADLPEQFDPVRARGFLERARSPADWLKIEEERPMLRQPDGTLVPMGSQQPAQAPQAAPQQPGGGQGPGQQTAPAASGGVQWPPPPPTGSFQQRLERRESGGNARAVNQFGFSGLRQFGAPRLTDLGVYRPGPGENVNARGATGGWSGQKWSGTFSIPGFPGVRTQQDFLNNPLAQQAVGYMDDQRKDQQIGRLGFDRYIGKVVGGVPITQNALHGMIHLGGAGGARAFLESDGRINPRDANGTSVGDYARLGAGVSTAGGGPAQPFPTPGPGDMPSAGPPGLPAPDPSLYQVPSPRFETPEPPPPPTSVAPDTQSWGVPLQPIATQVPTGIAGQPVPQQAGQPMPIVGRSGAPYNSPKVANAPPGQQYALDAQGRWVLVNIPGAVEPLETVQTPDGPRLVPRSQAAGSPAVEPMERVQTPDGPRLVPRSQAAGMPPAIEAKDPTADQSKMAYYAGRMRAAEQIIRENEKQGTHFGQRALSQMPLVPSIITNPMLSEGFQKLRQAEHDFVTAILRPESGAVISESEFANASRQYFPQPGDPPSVIEQKRENRRIALEGIERAAGSSAASRPAPAVPAQQPQQQGPMAIPPPPPGTVIVGP